MTDSINAGFSGFNPTVWLNRIFTFLGLLPLLPAEEMGASWLRSMDTLQMERASSDGCLVIMDLIVNRWLCCLPRVKGR